MLSKFAEIPNHNSNKAECNKHQLLFEDKIIHEQSFYHSCQRVHKYNIGKQSNPLVKHGQANIFFTLLNEGNEAFVDHHMQTSFAFLTSRIFNPLTVLLTLHVVLSLHIRVCLI